MLVARSDHRLVTFGASGFHRKLRVHSARPYFPRLVRSGYAHNLRLRGPDDGDLRRGVADRLHTAQADRELSRLLGECSQYRGFFPVDLLFQANRSPQSNYRHRQRAHRNPVACLHLPLPNRGHQSTSSGTRQPQEASA